LLITVNAHDNASTGGIAVGITGDAYSFDLGMTWTGNNTFVMTGNGGICVVVRDALGNESYGVCTNINNIDTTPPWIAFSPNGNLTPQQSHTIQVETVCNGLNTQSSDSWEYQWTQSAIAPLTGSFTTDLGSSCFPPFFIPLTTPSGENGERYLWFYGRDEAGNTTLAGTQAFLLDNIAPVVTLSGETIVTLYTGQTYREKGAIWTDNIDGNGILT
jgi:hypothetical protein